MQPELVSTKQFAVVGLWVELSPPSPGGHLHCLYSEWAYIYFMLACANQLGAELPGGRLASWPLMVQMSQQEHKATQALFLLFFFLREWRHPFPGVTSGSGWMLLFTQPGDRLVLGGGERGRGGTETQRPEGDSQSGSTGEKRTPDHHNPSGIPVFCTFEEPFREHSLCDGDQLFTSSCRRALAACCTTCCPWCRFEAGPPWPKAG